MDKFTTLTGIAAPMPLINIDTDMIIPKQFLKTIAAHRPRQEPVRRDALRRRTATRSPDFVLNQPAYRNAADPRRRRQLRLRLLARACALGAARLRHPLRDLDQLRRHLLQQLLQERHPADRAAAGGGRRADGRRRARAPTPRMTVDLESADGHRPPTAGCSPSRSMPSSKHCLLNGLDDIGLTLEKAAAIDTYEAAAAQARPWV